MQAAGLLASAKEPMLAYHPVPVVDVLGAPDVRELPEKLFTRYASEPCGGPCKERLWFENRLTLDIEAWSVELDQEDRVIHKAHWFSP